MDWQSWAYHGNLLLKEEQVNNDLDWYHIYELTQHFVVMFVFFIGTYRFWETNLEKNKIQNDAHVRYLQIWNSNTHIFFTSITSIYFLM